MEFVNQFIKGAVSDIDYLKRDGTVWTFPTINARVYNHEGQGLIITNVGGNEEAFSVSTNYFIIGACEYNGILYIVSRVRESDGYDSEECEIGCYPSPQTWDAENDSFSEEYKPLYNYNPGTMTNFRTSLLGFGTKRIEIIPRLSYDTSVDLIICDNIQPNIIVNSGFKQNGNWTGNTRWYTPEHFNGAIYQIPQEKQRTSVNSISWEVVEGGGRLRPGNYFIFIRFSTNDYARTQFLNYCGPIPVNEGNSLINSQGLPDKNIVSNVEPYTNKKISLTIDIDDTAYTYYELAVVRYSNDYDYGLAKANTYLLSRRYLISTTSVTITGLESTESLALEEIKASHIPYISCKTQIQVSNAYLGANWKKKTINYTALRDFAARITCSSKMNETDNIVMNNRLYDIEQQSVTDVHGYKDPEHYRRVGYFREQIYPFGIVYMFEDNTESEVYPIQGEINGVTNTKGLVKMFSWAESDNELRELYVQFNNSDAVQQLYEEDGDYELSDFEGVIGYRYVRGNRIDNLICQGYTLPCYDHILTAYSSSGTNTETHQWGFTFDENSEGWDQGNCFSIPLVEGMIPTALYDDDNQLAEEEAWHYSSGIDVVSDIYQIEGEDYFKYYISNSGGRINKTQRYRVPFVGTLKKIKFGFFSTDLNFVENPYLAADPYISLIRHNTPAYEQNSNHSFYTLWESTKVIPKFIGMDFNVGDTAEDHTLATELARKAKQVNARFIETFTKKGENGFTSYMPAKSARFTKKNSSGEVLDTMYNRSYRTSRYIGIMDSSDWPSVALFDYKYHIANLYRQDPVDLENTIVEAYNVFASEYFLVNNTVHSITSKMNTQCWNGDCFLQKTFIRIGRYYGFEFPGVKENATKLGIDGEIFLDAYENKYQWGVYLGIITENAYNAELRNEVYTRNEDGVPITYSYLPKAIATYDSVQNWVVLNDDVAQEGMQINDGYNRMLPPKTYLGYDSSYDYNNDTIRPNRIYFSGRDIPGAVLNNMRLIGVGSYKDYNPDGGPITKLCNIENFICVVQTNQLIQIAVNEKILETIPATTQLILGTSTEFLSDDFKKLADFGSQHQFATLATDKSVYGIDFLKKIIWAVRPSRASTGGVYLEAADMGLIHGCKSEIDDIFNTFHEGASVVTGLDDDTINGKGCLIGYDKDFKEVLFIFLAAGTGESSYYVLIYSEVINAFVGKYTFRTNMILNIDKKMFTVGLDYQNSNTPTNDVYLHNAGTPQTFYGEKKSMSISFVITGLTEGENVSTFKKIFEALAIDMNHEALSSITYETEYQASAYTFAVGTTDEWKNSEYLEHTWKVPVYIQTSVLETGEDESPDSEMRGRWMKVTLTYYPSTNPESIFIRSVITKFTLSAS